MLDKAKSQVTVEGGIRYGEIGPSLHEQGYALHNTASLPHISIAGACATATHGSGALGNLAVAVAGIEFIDGDGDLVTLSREVDGDTFAGAVVNLGALGVVTKLTLDLRPAFHVRQDVFRELPLAALETHFDEIMSSAYSVSVFTAWQTDTIEQVWLKSVVEPGSTFPARDSLFGARPARTNLHPIPNLDAVNCTRADGSCRSGVRSASSFPHGIHAGKRRRAPGRVFRAKGICRASNPHPKTTARPTDGSLARERDTHGRRR